MGDSAGVIVGTDRQVVVSLSDDYRHFTELHESDSGAEYTPRRGGYSLAVITRAVLHWDEITLVMPENRQPTEVQMLRCDMQLAFKAHKAAAGEDLEVDALIICRTQELLIPQRSEIMARFVAGYLLPYLNGGLALRKVG